MAPKAFSVFEVLDNFFESRTCPPAEQLNNAKIRALRERVVEFYKAHDVIPHGDYETRLYLGAFLCSPPFSIEAAPYISSALLCSDSIVLFDPLHHWFCDEQYSRLRLLSAPTGWRNLQTRRPDYPLTKKYLSQAFLWLNSIRPLVDAGIVVLIPAEQIVHARSSEVGEFTTGITGHLEPVEKLSELFSPDEITVDENRKGLFAFAGGSRTQQIRKWVIRGIEHFARDVIISNTTSSLYTAPFRWEQHLGKSTLNSFSIAERETRVVEAIRNLRLPILSKLSPEVLVKIHKDSGYTTFRAGLRETLHCIDTEIDSQDFIDRVAQIERDILLPKVEAIHREIQSSLFQRATNAVQEGFFAFTQTFLSNVPTGLDVERDLAASAISGGLAFLRETFKRVSKSRDHRIWAQLLPQKPSLSIYGPPLTLKHQEGVKWDIDDKPSMQLKVSAGVIKSWMS